MHVDIVKEIAEGNKTTLALLPNRSEEDEINNKGKTRNINFRKSNPIFKPPERLGSVPCFSTWNIIRVPTRKEAPKPRLLTTTEIESDYDPSDNYDNYETK